MDCPSRHGLGRPIASHGFSPLHPLCGCQRGAVLVSCPFSCHTPCCPLAGSALSVPPFHRKVGFPLVAFFLGYSGAHSGTFVLRCCLRLFTTYVCLRESGFRCSFGLGLGLGPRHLGLFSFSSCALHIFRGFAAPQDSRWVGMRSCRCYSPFWLWSPRFFC